MATTDLELQSAARAQPPRAAGEDLQVLAVAALMGSAAVHAAVVPKHLDHWPAAGAFFAVLALLEGASAATLLVRLRWPVALAALTVSLVPLPVWVVSRTVGLPFGPEAGSPEPVAWADLAAVSLTVAAVVLTGLLLRATAPEHWRFTRVAAWGPRLALAAVALVTAVGISSALSPAAAPVPGTGGQPAHSGTNQGH